MLDNSSPVEHLPIDFQAVFESMPGSFVILQPNAPDYTILAISDEMLRITGREKHHIIGKNLFEVFPENPQATTAPGPSRLGISLQNALEHKSVDQMPVVRYDITNPEGEFQERYWAASNKPVLNRQGEVLYLIHSTVEVTEQVLTQNKIAESESRFQSMAEAAGILIAHTDHIGNAIYFNQEWLQLTGRTMDELINYGWVDLFHEEDRAGFVEAYKTAFEQRQVLKREFRLWSQKGEYRWQLAVVSPRFGTNGTFTGYISSCVDITELKQAEAALSQSEDQFRAFADNIQNLAWMAHADGWIYWYNQQWYDYTGTTLEKMLGWGWEKVHHPDHIDRVLAFVKQAWMKGETWELTFPLKGADGAYRWFLTRGAAIKDEAGNVVRWIGTNTDITEQIKAEETLQKRNAELQIINDDLDNFIYAASHDLKTPILNIEGIMGALQDQLSPTSLQAADIQYTLHLMLDSVQRFKRTIGHLTEVTKLQKENSLAATPLDLARVIAEVQLDLAPNIREAQAQVQVEVASCPTIYFSEKNLRSIIYNLLLNALKYRSPSRHTWVKIQCTQTDEYQVLSVQDNGLGIDLSGKPKLFSMFKRLHDHVEGSGVGLYMVKKIMENAGGQIKVQSKVDEGSTFQVYFRRNK